MHPVHVHDQLPRLRPLRRPDGSVQIGWGTRSVRLLGLTDAECRWLAALDPQRALGDVVSTAALEGIGPARATDILERLVTGGVLQPVSADSPASVAVVGSGALPALLVDGLRQHEHVRAHRVRPGGEAETTVDLAVVVTTTPPPPELLHPWLGARVPVLPLWCLPDQASIGPLVRHDQGPCPRCLDHTRASVDPAWPWLCAQLTRARVEGGEPVDGLPAIRLLTAGLATALVLDHVGGRLGTPDWSFEVAVPGPTLERHRWPRHPGCLGCAPPLAETVDPEPETRATATPVGRDPADQDPAGRDPARGGPLAG